MQDPWTTPAKRLGWLNQPDFCPRCFYLQKLIGFKKPWSIGMPIYGALDRVQKRFVEQTLDRTGKLPDWLAEVGDIGGYVKPPHHSKFFYIDEATGLKVRGEADLILKRSDGKIAIVDLKTSRSFGRDMLLPTYEVQQNAYAVAAAAQGLGEVASLHLAYLAIDEEQSLTASLSGSGPGEMLASFDPQIYPLGLDSSILPPLCQRHVDLCQMTTMPEPIEGCKNCELILTMAEAAGKYTHALPAKSTASHPSPVVLFQRPTDSITPQQLAFASRKLLEMVYRKDKEAQKFVATWGRQVYAQLGMRQ